ncbi:hypothetical protein Pla110_05690 [Polystyrenella longa]|uniref:HEAT repeat protein n=1 Tax=Polystyrenella longa TaxID=2528007 RepID=A0A518CI11_9PLAN|nr:hypothetical protein [Polystyrenella longa]QDU78865.1 hypothetical protein Pla110_05690 [Polystyrenella longa]
MSKQTIQYAVLGIALLLITVYLLLYFLGFNQERPGVRYTAGTGTPIAYDIHAPENKDDKLNKITDMVLGEDMGRAYLGAVALGRMGADAEPKLKQLKLLKDHPNENVRGAIIKSIEQIEADIAKQSGGGG